MDKKKSELIMLEHSKIVLRGVAEDAYLFKKELKKAMSWLTNNEKIALEVWVKKHYYQDHKDVIDAIFHPQYFWAS